MALLVAVQAVERSVWQGNAPSRADINAAFDAAMQSVRGAADTETRWVGPMGARIVRSYDTGALAANVTSAANVAQVPSADVATRLRQALEARLAAVGNWTVAAADYSPAVNGSLDFWTTGQYSITRTGDAFPELGGRFDAAQNPVGPDSRDTRNSTIGEGLGDVARQVGAGAQRAALSIGAVALIALGGWAAYENRDAISKGLRVSKSAT